MILETYSEALTQSFLNLWGKTITLLPQIIGALIIILIGIVLGVILAGLVKKLVQSSKLDKISKDLGFEALTKKIGGPFDLAAAIAWLVKWFIIIAFFMAASEVLNLEEVSKFLSKILAYIPEVIIAVIIIMVGMIVANFLSRLVKNYIQATGLPYRNLAASITKWAIYIFTILAALNQLRIATELVTTLFKGIVFMVALAGGIAFGLGGKEAARKTIEGFKKEVEEYKE